MNAVKSVHVLNDAERARLEAGYRDIGPGLWRAILFFSGGLRDIADEAVAEAFAQACRRIGKIRDLKAWLYKAAFRIASEEMRARRSAPQDLTRADNASLASSPGQLTVEELLEVSRSLSPNQRVAFVLRDVFGYSSREAAQLSKLSDVAIPFTYMLPGPA